MKLIIYLIYATFFYIYRLLPIDVNKTTFIMTHDESINGNIMRMYKVLKEQQPNAQCYFIKKQRKPKCLKEFGQALLYIVRTPYELATSKTIFLDNVFLPMTFLKFNKEVKVVQLWHGCNTLKKFGQLSNKGVLKWLEKKSNSHYTHLMVSSEKMIQLHEEAFGVSKEVIYPLGLPRMDLFYDLAQQKVLKEAFYKRHPKLKEKKIILYAPTFRDNDMSLLSSEMDLSSLVKKLPKDCCLVTKYHPFVVKNRQLQEGIIDLSVGEDLTTLLVVADLLITDYSSIIFDYSLLNKPVICYAYDEEEYAQKIRGFYYEYETYIEAPLVRNQLDLLVAIKQGLKEKCNRDLFVDKYLTHKSNEAALNIYKEIYKKG